MFRTRLIWAFSAIALVSTPALATVITSDPADFEARLRSTGSYDPGPSVTATTLRVGFQSGFQITGVYFFQLPALAPGQNIGSANFSVSSLPDNATTAITPTHNADLVALGFTNTSPPANTAAESQAYYYVGQGAADPAPGRQLIQDNFLVPSDFIPNGGVPALRSTSAAGDAALLMYIQGLYADPGFVPGLSYLILRANPDQTSGAGTNRYSLASAETTLAGATVPSLTLEIIPEPASMLVIAAAGTLLLLRRRAPRV